MPEQCFALNCPNPGDDEYTFYVPVPALNNREFPVTWKLCARHCEFAIEVVELVSNLDEEMEIWVRDTHT